MSHRMRFYCTAIDYVYFLTIEIASFWTCHCNRQQYDTVAYYRSVTGSGCGRNLLLDLLWDCAEDIFCDQENREMEEAKTSLSQREEDDEYYTHCTYTFSTSIFKKFTGTYTNNTHLNYTLTLIGARLCESSPVTHQ